LPIRGGDEGHHADEHQRQQRGHQPQRCLEAQALQQQPAEEEADALHRVLAAREEGHPLEELARGAACRELDRRLAGRLGQVLGHAADALSQHHPGDRRRGRPGGRQRRQQQEAGDLRGQADGQHPGNAIARGQPAADEVGSDASRLVQQEEEGQREGRVAQAVEVQQHQHAQRAVGEGEAPVRRGDDGVVAGAAVHDDAWSGQTPAARMWQARSTMRQA
jgi:hypothetical protein